MALSVEHLKKLEELKKCYCVSYGKPVDFDSVYDKFRNSKVNRNERRGYHRSKTYVDTESNKSSEISLSCLRFDSKSVSSASTDGRDNHEDTKHTKDSEVKNNNHAIQKSRVDARSPMNRSSDNFSKLDTPSRKLQRSQSFNDANSISKKRSVKFHDAIGIEDSLSKHTLLVDESKCVTANNHALSAMWLTDNTSQLRRDGRRSRSFCDATGKPVSRSKYYRKIDESIHAEHKKKNSNHSSISTSFSLQITDKQNEIITVSSNNYHKHVIENSNVREMIEIKAAGTLPEVRPPRHIQRSRSLYDSKSKPIEVKKTNSKVYDTLNLDITPSQTSCTSKSVQNRAVISKQDMSSRDRKYMIPNNHGNNYSDATDTCINDANKNTVTVTEVSDLNKLPNIKRQKRVQRSISLNDSKSKPFVIKRKSHTIYENLNLETLSMRSNDASAISTVNSKSISVADALQKTQHEKLHTSNENNTCLNSVSTDVRLNDSIQTPDIDFKSNNVTEAHNRYSISKESGLNKVDSQKLISVAEIGVNGNIKLPIIAEEMGDGRVAPGDLQRIREDATGHLLCWGCGEFGQHGHGYKKQIGFVDGAIEMFCDDPADMAKHVSCGSSHTAVVTANNDIYLWGNGNSGQLGSSDLNTKLVPTKVALYANQDKAPNIGGISCGGRHTMVWLENGHVFSFGNNFHAQLGYDFRQKNYKENQKRSDGFWDDDDDNTDHFVAQPTLLKFLTHRAVVQVACGDKHSVFRFKDGGVACVGNNANGQIGTGTRDDALVPKFLENFTQHMVHIAAGSHHTLAVTEDGEMYVWGYGKACGSKQSDVLSPMKLSTSRRNVIMVAGGSSHSMALTANGSVYTWGGGHDGQLGHGDKVRFVAYPRRVKDRHIYSKCIQITCGENLSAAITEKGLLYMWGKNSHTVMPNKPTTHKIFLPYGVNKNFRGGRLYKVFCGSWHAVSLIGRPELLLRDGEESGESDSENVPTQEEVDAIFKDSSVSGDDDSDDVALPNVDNDVRDVPGRISRREDSKLEREKTSVSLADFYAPTPDLKNPRSPSPTFYHHNSIASDDEPKTDRAGLNTSRSATLVVQLPVQPMTTYTDAACSPMTLTTTSSMKSSSVTTSSRVPSPIHEIPVKPSSRASKGILKPEKKFKEFDPAKYEKEKLRIVTPVLSEVVQFSKTSADAFTLPREPTGLARKHVDFSEMEEIRLKGPKSPEKLSRGSKRRDRRDGSPLKIINREMSPTKLKEPLSSRSRMRATDSSLSHKSDSALMESPLFRSGHTRNVSSTEQPKKPWNVNSPEEDRQYRHHVPKQLPKKYKPPRSSESNFGLQISRSKTIVTPLQPEGFESPDRLAQIRRYAAMHNPQSTSGRGINEKLKPIKTRQASIPTRRPESPMDEADQLFIGSLGSTNKPSFSSGSTWRDRSDFDKVTQPRKMAAGIVRMYITNNELTGGVDNNLYSSLSDGRGHGDPLLEGDPFIVQPLLKKKVPKLSEDTPSLLLPEISNTHNINASLKEASKRSDNRLEMDTDFDTTFTATPRLDVVDSRVG